MVLYFRSNNNVGHIEIIFIVGLMGCSDKLRKVMFAIYCRLQLKLMSFSFHINVSYIIESQSISKSFKGRKTNNMSVISFCLLSIHSISYEPEQCKWIQENTMIPFFWVSHSFLVYTSINLYNMNKLYYISLLFCFNF